MSVRNEIITYLEEEKYTLEEIAEFVGVKVEVVLEIVKKKWKIRKETERIYLKSAKSTEFRRSIYEAVKQKHNIIINELRS